MSIVAGVYRRRSEKYQAKPGTAPGTRHAVVCPRACAAKAVYPEGGTGTLPKEESKNTTWRCALHNSMSYETSPFVSDQDIRTD